MKDGQTILKRIAVCAVLSIPFYLMGTTGWFAPAVGGYIISAAMYWLIQMLTDFRRPSDGLLVIFVLASLCCIIAPALLKAHSRSISTGIASQAGTSLSAARNTLAPALSNLENRVGQRVELEGIVSNTKAPQIQGVDVWDLDAYRGRRVRVSGILHKTVYTQADIDKATFAHRGAGTFYSLDNIRYELIK